MHQIPPPPPTHTADVQNGSAQPRERCPGKGGAKKAARAYASDFYAGPGPVLLEGARRGVQYRVEEPSGGAATPAPGGGAVLFTPPQRCAVIYRTKSPPPTLEVGGGVGGEVGGGVGGEVGGVGGGSRR